MTSDNDFEWFLVTVDFSLLSSAAEGADRTGEGDRSICCVEIQNTLILPQPEPSLRTEYLRFQAIYVLDVARAGAHCWKVGRV